MTTRSRWTIGLLLALVIGLGVGLAIVAGDDSKEATVTVSGTVDTPNSEATTIETTPTQTSDTESGGVSPPDSTATGPSDGSGGLGR